MLPGDAELSIALNPAAVRPATDTEADVATARAVDGIADRIFLGPLFHGGYPDDVVTAIRAGGVNDRKHVYPGDVEVIGARIDALGVNYYSPMIVEAGTPRPWSRCCAGSTGMCPGSR